MTFTPIYEVKVMLPTAGGSRGLAPRATPRTLKVLTTAEWTGPSADYWLWVIPSSGTVVVE